MSIAPMYVIKDAYFGELAIKGSANAWWIDSLKVNELIKAFKYDATVQEACVLAGITKAQWEYFNNEHPDFSDVVAACRELPVLKARSNVVSNLDKDLTTARWYLERKKAVEFGQKMPTVAVQINMGQRMANKKQDYEQ